MLPEVEVIRSYYGFCSKVIWFLHVIKLMSGRIFNHIRKKLKRTSIIITSTYTVLANKVRRKISWPTSK